MKITLTLDIPGLPSPDAPHSYQLDAACFKLHDIADPDAKPIYVAATDKDFGTSAVVSGDLLVTGEGHVVDGCCPTEDEECCGNSNYYDLRGATISISHGECITSDGLVAALKAGIARASADGAVRPRSGFDPLVDFAPPKET
jgi:hypothetical protein